ncbi:MAG: helix-turn-helix domain-containing protein [Bacillota bacterium]
MFCKRLEKLRTDKNLTHQQIADFLGVTRQAYGNYENGKREPDFETVKKLADFFGVSVDYLLGSTSNPSPPAPKTKKLYDAIYRVVRCKQSRGCAVLRILRCRNRTDPSRTTYDLGGIDTGSRRRSRRIGSRYNRNR